MNISKIVLMLLVLNTGCFASKGEQATQQPAQAQPSFWSYFKYLDPYYYWQKYQLSRLEAEIETKRQKMIEKFDKDIGLLQSDITILESTTSIDELNQKKAELKTDFVLHKLITLKDDLESFLKQKNDIIQELKKDKEVLINLKKQAEINEKIELLDQEVEVLQEKKKELKEQIENNK